MHSFFSKSFGCLTASYYIRQLIFGSLFAILIISLAANSAGGLLSRPGLVIMSVFCTLLYPYSRFVYESVVGYVMGDNVFFVNAGMMLMVKTFTMSMCWAFAGVIAPVGLVYLYLRNTGRISQ